MRKRLIFIIYLTLLIITLIKLVFSSEICYTFKVSGYIIDLNTGSRISGVLINFTVVYQEYADGPFVEASTWAYSDANGYYNAHFDIPEPYYIWHAEGMRITGYPSDVSIPDESQGTRWVYRLSSNGPTTWGDPDAWWNQPDFRGTDWMVIDSDPNYNWIPYQTNPTCGTEEPPPPPPILDYDANGIFDEYEMPLAEKFVPEMKPHSAYEWLAPEPVEIMGVAGNDIYIRLWDEAGNFFGEYPLYEFAYYGNDGYVHIPISESCEYNCNYSYLYEIMESNGVYITENNILRFDNGSGLWDSENQEIDPFPGVTIGIIHYEWAGIDGNNPDAWNNAYQNERANNNYAHTTYAHLFKSGDQYVIQYWFFYPYNDFVNNHEGDWEHINVITNSQDPTIAELVRVDYYFHHKVQIRDYPDLEVVGGTHPIVYIGGTNPSYDGLHSGGNFPETGLWENVGEAGIDEYVLGRGPTISYSSFIDGNPNDRRGIVILPYADFIDYNQNPEMSWFKLDIQWGHLSVDDPWNWVPIYDGNQPPKGPYYNAGWHRIGSVPQGDYPYGYELYTGRPQEPLPKKPID